MSEFQQLIQNTLPSARDVLRENYSNLLKVADFCDSNYEQAQDKRKALEETMTFTVQSLANVTYQINNLARNILKTFDLQTTHLQQVEANICSIEQVIEMHKEKVSRREIGMLTVCKTFPPYQKIIYPKKLEPLQPYYRKPLDFNTLDDIGHGIKDQSHSWPKQGLYQGDQSSLRLGCHLELWKEPEGPRSNSATTHPRRPTLNSFIFVVNKVPLGLLPHLPFLPSTEFSSPLSTDFLPPPPPVQAEDVLPLPYPETDLDFPTFPLPPSLDNSNYGHLKPPLLPPPPPPEKLSWAPDTYLEKVVTLYPYVQKKEDELSFTEGAIIYVTRKYSNGCVGGVTCDAEGFFPENYTEPLQ
ncbi:LOW QUALITY PROTEIN: ABI gene family member 3 [Thamnophis elegans]|uniref:LOW QUALITY PROTEIN: ABI gene family member 3 n=1 Tax=Thamnophis elegans TaxID=35005 RepID=UPI001377790E|nr:LOW QUALITY PROTEIN: ABI gene family member 3 [Thamnophis elegans]